MLVYDVTKRITFDNIRAWLKDTHDYGNENIVLILVGNKADLVNE